MPSIPIFNIFKQSSLTLKNMEADPCILELEKLRHNDLPDGTKLVGSSADTQSQTLAP